MARIDVKTFAWALVAAGVLAGCSGADTSLEASRSPVDDRDALAEDAEGGDRDATTIAQARALLDEAERAAVDAVAVADAGNVTPPAAHGRTEQLGEPGVVEIGNWHPPVDVDAASRPTIDDIYPTKGPVTGGEQVVIRGSNLDAAQVVFGVTPARVLKVTSDSITVAAPAEEAGTVTIVVTTRAGQYAMGSAPFEYYN